MLVAASRFAEELMPSSDRLFWISRWPAPLKLRPISLFRPARTPGVVLARFQTLRPLSGKSTTSRLPMVSETVALSVARKVAEAATVIVSARVPSCRTAFVRTTWLLATSIPVDLND